MPPRRRRLVAPVLAALLLLPGCGNEPTRPPDPGRPQLNEGQRAVELSDQGLRLDVPGRWRVRRGTAPLVLSAVSGRATLALWRYPRTETLPRTRSDLEATRDSLVAAVKARDPGFVVESSRILTGRERRGVELLGTGTNEGARRRVRSLHLFADGAEVVADAYAPPQEFVELDGEVFRPALRSVRFVPSATGG